jgi:hypothetical protein
MVSWGSVICRRGGPWYPGAGLYVGEEGHGILGQGHM